MNSRALAFTIACLVLQGMALPLVSVASEATRTVKLDGKTLYIPEVPLNRKINPVPKFLYIGTWSIKPKADKLENPLCVIDSKNNTLLISSSENLLDNSKTRVGTPDSINAFLDSLPWEQRQATHIAFNITSLRRQPAVLEINTSAGAALFQNGKFICDVSSDNAKNSDGRGYLPIILQPGENLINIRYDTRREKPRFQISVCLDHSLDLQTAMQPKHGLLRTLVYIPRGKGALVTLDWNPNLSGFSPSLEIRNLSTNKIILRKPSVRAGIVTDEAGASLPPGIYEAAYRFGNQTATEQFIVGSPNNLFSELQDALSQYDSDPKTKPDIDAQLLRAKILFAKENYNVGDRQWQEKAAYTLGSLATIERKLRDGVANITEPQSGIIIRNFISSADDSTQTCRLFIPSTYNSAAPLPLLVIPSTRIANQEHAFIEGPVMANHRQAVLWAKSAEQHGFAVLWPGYRADPDGHSYESVNINDAIKAVEKDYAIDNHRVSIYATCSAGYNAGRLIEEYPNRFAAIVYDLAVFDLSLNTIKSVPSLMEWYSTVNPSRHVINNKNLKIFVMHDNTKPAGHGPLEETSDFLDRAAKARNDITSYLTTRPMTLPDRANKTFTWLVPCKNENPDDKRSNFPSKAGYTGPIMEIFATPLIVVEGTRASGGSVENIQNIVASIKKDYANYFHGAQCAIKKDSDVTQEDVDTHSLILVGNPQSNSAWEKLQTKLPLEVTSSEILYENSRLTGNQPFQAIVRNPYANGKYVLMIGAGDLRTLDQVTTDELFTAWYDCILFPSGKVISQLDFLTRADAKQGSKQQEL